MRTRSDTGNTVDGQAETVFTQHMTTTKCTGSRYYINPDAPEEGTDIHHLRPCPAHPDAVATGHHIHQDDAPRALDLLFRLIGEGRPGFQRTEHGAFVDWDLLIPGTFSTSETAVAHIAHGVAILEAHGGGAPARMRRAINDAIEAIAW